MNGNVTAQPQPIHAVSASHQQQAFLNLDHCAPDPFKAAMDAYNQAILAQHTQGNAGSAIPNTLPTSVSGFMGHIPSRQHSASTINHIPQ